jgi:hypothetical protein
MTPVFEIVHEAGVYKVKSGQSYYGPDCPTKKAAEELKKDWEAYHAEDETHHRLHG